MHPLLSRNGSPNERTWNSKALPEIQNFFRRKNLDDTILKKIKYHAVESSLQAQAYDIVYQPIRQIRKQLAESEPCRESHCLLIEGDLDEIVGAEALRAIRGCVGASPTGEPDSSEINAAVSMPFLRYGFGYASSAFSSVERGGYRWRAWVKPPFVHEIGPGKTVAGQGVDVADSAFAETRSEENNAMPDEKPESQIEKIGYVYQARHELVHTTGKPLGWHLAWTLDGGPGLANKVSKTMVEKMDIYPALNAKLKAISESSSATETGQADNIAAITSLFNNIVRDPLGVNNDGVTVPSDLGVEDLPKSVVEDPDEFRSLLGTRLYELVKQGTK